MTPAVGAHSLRTIPGVYRYLRHELLPHHGRVEIVGRMVLSSVITMLLVMTFKIPYGFLAIFYALAISRENPHATLRNGLNIIAANVAGAIFVIFGAVLLIDQPLTHFLFVAISFFVVFFVTRTARNFSVAFGFGIMVVAGAALIWMRPNPAELRLEITIGAAFGIVVGTVVTIVVEWLLVPVHKRRGPPATWHIFVPNALSESEHWIYALKGCLAGCVCFAIWSALAWPGLGECIITCVIVAPVGTPGSSRRQMVTRCAGVLIGGLLFGIGSQIWILPYLDSIASFTVVFAVISGIAAWLATASPSVSYLGRQVALAYDVAAFQGFASRTPLAASWSPQMGIFLGLAVMWMIFDAPRVFRRTAAHKSA